MDPQLGVLTARSLLLRVCLGQGFEVCRKRDRGINNIENGEGV